jgi:hypothetical protein
VHFCGRQRSRPVALPDALASSLRVRLPAAFALLPHMKRPPDVTATRPSPGGGAPQVGRDSGGPARSQRRCSHSSSRRSEIEQDAAEREGSDQRRVQSKRCGPEQTANLLISDAVLGNGPARTRRRQRDSRRGADHGAAGAGSDVDCGTGRVNRVGSHVTHAVALLDVDHGEPPVSARPPMQRPPRGS